MEPKKITTTAFSSGSQLNITIGNLENQGWTIQDVKPCTDGLNYLIIAYKYQVVVPIDETNL